MSGQHKFIQVPTTAAHPKQLGPCASCAAWDRANIMNVALTDRGALPVAALIKAGQTPPSGSIQCVAWCTLAPRWEYTSDDHWCWQFTDELDDDPLN